MGQFKIEGVTHWSIPVNNIAESEKFYGDLLGLKHLGRLGNAVMSCYNVGDHNILLCERAKLLDGGSAAGAINSGRYSRMGRVTYGRYRVKVRSSAVGL